MSWRVLVLLSLWLSVAGASADVQAVQATQDQDQDPPTSRFAYVTVHYEGTSRDAEYVLGVQILMHSIKMTGSPYDLVVLASDSVSERSKTLFRSMGCRVLDVSNIENPFVGGTLRNKNFIYTLNKLHVWNLLEYERVVYLDADNVLIRNSDELFLCGEFYQGFLSSMYSKMLRKAKLFTPMKMAYPGADQDAVDKAEPKPKGMRLPVGYNINHKYYYEQYNWKLFYLRHFASMTSPISPVKVVVESARGIPALTVGYPMAPVLKPWYWWAGFFMDLHVVWHDIRATLPASQERYGAEEAVKTLLGFFSSLALLTAALYALKLTLPMRQIQQRCTDLALRNSKQARFAFLAFRMALVVFAFRIAPARVHPLAPVHYGYGLMIFMNLFLHIYFACVVSNFWSPNQEVSMPPVLYVTRFWLYVALTVVFELCVVWISTWNVFINVLWRLFTLFWAVFLCGYWQVTYYRLSLNAEFVGKKERLRSL
ncbi:hypothetical protein BBO99_00006108 [Phytophthora kernoviae]|uniref:Uncharacterized protein n=2 Tax=Phytophthora kernoviae TaxID=325452 RepID=A0A3R7FZC9_9STRA|nr:hypothetical protein G195_006889 [Phytophthora kernoviae 00238/432]KAG2522176.1 hypothetical protein JM16_005921 [Phytophthora kernoviae]KAG2523796.1 hypothetical protein JM18_005635 [Phytophthora kernoviae]RLN13997.1 hypothetical protein BBI17_006231 [Phytophthora kernoviae]RLN52252.1 hypothetical protein BBJ29_003490 [Phytophthora kernoviae]